jgi:hypothetical protein
MTILFYKWASLFETSSKLLINLNETTILKEKIKPYLINQDGALKILLIVVTLQL